MEPWSNAHRVMLAVGVVGAALAVEAPTGTAVAAITVAAPAALHRDLIFLRW